MMRTLYIEHGRVESVVRDGPALRVRASGSADQLFPLPRIARVVVVGPAPLPVDVLLACAGARVPVAFVGRDGTARATLMPPPDPRAVVSVHEAMDALLDRADGAARYRRWAFSSERRARLDLMRSIGRPGYVVSEARIRSAFQGRATLHVCADDVRRFHSRVRGLLDVHTLEFLERAGIQPGSLRLGTAGILPHRDFTRIAWWTLEVPALRLLKRLGVAAKRRGDGRVHLPWREAARFFEQQRSEIDGRLERLLRDFHLWLLEEITSADDQ